MLKIKYKENFWTNCLEKYKPVLMSMALSSLPRGLSSCLPPVPNVLRTFPHSILTTLSGRFCTYPHFTVAARDREMKEVIHHTRQEVPELLFESNDSPFHVWTFNYDFFPSAKVCSPWFSKPKSSKSENAFWSPTDLSLLCELGWQDRISSPPGKKKRRNVLLQFWLQSLFSFTLWS